MEMELEENQFMVQLLKMKISLKSILDQAFYQWLTQDQIQMDHNFLSRLLKQRFFFNLKKILTVNKF